MIVPEWLSEKVLAWFGEEGRTWVEDGLPQVVERLAAEWELEIGEPFRGGTHALVLRVSGPDRVPLVLKIPLVDDENRAEEEVLRHYGGAAAVLLHKFDSVTGALLEERLLPGTPLSSHPDRGAAIAVACELLERLRTPPATGHSFSFTNTVAAEMARSMPIDYRALGQPFPVRWIDQAVTLAQDLASQPPGDRVVNRDAHMGNILAAEREPWLLIDPKPLVGDASFDLSYLLIDLLRDSAMKPAHALDQISSGVDGESIRDWAFVRAVESALWCLKVGEDPRSDLGIVELLQA